MKTALQRLGHYFLFTHISPYVAKGKNRAITSEDLPPLDPGFAPTKNGEDLLNLSKARSRRDLLKNILGFSKHSIYVLSSLTLITTLLQLSVPLLSKEVIADVQKFSEGRQNLGFTSLRVALLLLCSLGEGILVQVFYYKSLVQIAEIANILRQNIFAKSLRLNMAAKNHLDTGEILNYQGSDTDALSELIFYLILIISGFITLFAVFSFLFLYFGVASILGVLIVLVFFPVSKKLTRLTLGNYQQLMQVKDERIDLLSQVIGAMRLVKMYAWDRKFAGLISKIRERELNFLRRDLKISVISMIFHNSTAFLIGATIFGCHLALGGTLDAPRVFSSLIFLSLIEGPLGHMTQWISTIAKALTGAERIQKFFAQEEASPISCARRQESSTPPKIDIVGYSGRYDKLGPCVLEDINLTLSTGSSLAIVGPVGSGKTALLLAILQELIDSKGYITVSGSGGAGPTCQAYVPQSAFILSGSIKYNVTLSSDEPDYLRLHQALNAAQFTDDLREMPLGIETEIGENGINLSGGQKHRLNIARAIYHRPKLVLMDDPFSAVDSSTEKELIDKVIFGCFQNTTRIVTTHRLDYLSRFDQVAYLVAGKLHAMGTFSQLLASCPDFTRFVCEHKEENFNQSQFVAHSMSGQALSGDNSESPTTESDTPNLESKLYQDEDRETGKVRWELLNYYLKSLLGGNRKQRLYSLFVLILIMGSGLYVPIYQNVWLAQWMNFLGEKALATKEHIAWYFRSWTAFGIYFSLGFVGVCLFVIQYLSWFLRAFKASRHIHNQALGALFLAPMRFFDTTPQGRILNRFSRDLERVEQQLSGSSFSALNQALATLGALSLLLYLFPVLFVLILGVLAIYYVLQDRYRKVAREATRLASIARSPIFSFFKESLSGIVVIRCFNAQSEFKNRNFCHLTRFQHAFGSQVLFNRWFSTRIPLVAALVFLAVLIAITYFSHLGLLAAGSAGLALAYSARFWGSLNWCIRIFSAAESDLTSLERIRHYFSVQPESEYFTAPVSVKPSWPENPSVVFNEVSARYSEELPLVLKSVSFSIPPGAKVGIIGRTGSGKSTIFQLLFRLIHPASGSILIDGIDIGSIPLARLRNALAIIPQDPVLFRGTLRENLDRFDAYTDAELWQVLGALNLEMKIIKMSGSLMAEISENGSNFSQGERQLICLCRALLSKTKIVVLDEATANVDTQTDSIIQSAIRLWFKSRTVITIAHRLDTVKHADFIIEMSQGRIKDIKGLK